ncbi:MAG: oligogalacturonide lyase [Armatimonadetes bacterium]|nr:oligogalacturonide lyase [Armatimonadota bacterium]
MTVGTVTPPEWRELTDPVSGVRLRQLTSYKTNSHHLYFTNPGWYAGGRKLLFGSERYNRSNLYGIDLESGEITQLTDLEPPPKREVTFLGVSVNPTRDEAYFTYGQELRAVALDTFEQRTLWTMPAGFRPSMLNCTADGKWVCIGIAEDLSREIRTDMLRGYIGFRETFEANPECHVVRVATDGSGGESVWQEQTWIGHVNTSPTHANLLTFCHEGPWDKVDNRIWGFDLDTGKAWMIRPREAGENPGHEYWHADGVTVGYHGRRPDGSKFLGKTRYDNTDRFEADFPGETGHIHSNDFHLIVGDGGSVIRAWQWNGASFDGPRVLAEHRSSMKIQQAHPHPRFNADGTKVVFTSDWTGYCQVYEAEVPEFAALPAAKT